MPNEARSGPEWRHVVATGETNTRGGDAKVQCNYCSKEFVGGATRIAAHLLGEKGAGVSACPDVTEGVVAEFAARKLEKERAAQAKVKKRKLAESAARSLLPVRTQSTLSQVFSKKDKESVDMAAARFFYSNGIPFNVANSPYFTKFVADVAAFGPGYKPPKRDVLRETLLVKEKSRIQKLLQPVVDSLDTQGCTLTSDGWSNTQNRPLLNYLLVTTKGNIFLGATDTSGERKSAEYIAEELCTQIQEVRMQHFFGLCSGFILASVSFFLGRFLLRVCLKA
jgi:hypothetical protein